MLFHWKQRCSTLILAAISVHVDAAPLGLNSRAVIAHNAVVGFPQTVPSTLEGSLMLKYKPWLEVYNGCVPFPAVNAAGDTRYEYGFRILVSAHAF
jgi:hypothetical protein